MHGPFVRFRYPLGEGLPSRPWTVNLQFPFLSPTAYAPSRSLSETFISLMPFSASLSRSQSDSALRSFSKHNPFSAWFSLIYPHLIQPRHDPSQGMVVLFISSMHPFKFTELDDI